MNKKLIFSGIILVVILIGSVIIMNLFKKDNVELIEDNKFTDSYEVSIEEKYINDIYGVLYKPKTDKKVPLIIFSHELGSTHSSGDDYAEYLSKLGFAFYAFDFRNGSYSSKSGNDMSKMSVMTEVNDLLEVFNEAKNWDFVDTNKIIIMGGSQGGAVTALTAPKIEDEISGVIIMYPALLIHDDVHSRFNSLDEVPETFTYRGWFTAGKIYVEDAWNLDTYKEISKYNKKVLILHGTSDSIVPYSYSEEADKSYKNSELHLIKGAGHGFYGSSFDEAIIHIVNYLNEII